MVFSFVKDQIYFDDDNKNGFLCSRKKSDLFLYLKKTFFLWRGSHSHNNFPLHDSNKTNDKATIHDLFLYFKSLHMF